MLRKVNLVVIFVLILSMFFVSNVLAKTITLTLSETDPPTSIVGVYVNTIKNEIETRTEGQVKVDVYWAESLLTGKENLKGVKDGVVDIGKVVPTHFPEELFVYGIFNIFPCGPTKFENIYEIITRAHEEIPYLNEEFTAQNQKVLGFRLMMPSSVFSTEPFTSFEDFKGKRIRAASRWWLAFLKGAGAIPVYLPYGDCYMALETGNIEGVYTNVDALFRTKMHEPAPNIFLTRELWTPTPTVYTINMEKWDSLPDNIKKDIEDSFEAVIGIFAEAYDNEWENIVSQLEEGGQVVTMATKEDIQKWVSMPIIEESQAQWISEAEDFGIDNAEEIVNRMKVLIQQGIDKENK